MTIPCIFEEVIKVTKILECILRNKHARQRAKIYYYYQVLDLKTLVRAVEVS